MSCSLVVAVLKENYTRLCQSLPKDYMKTINKMTQLIKIPDYALSSLTNSPTVDYANERIILFMLKAIHSEVDALQFCDVIEMLVDNESSQTFVEVLRNGMCVRMYI